ncbi:MAG: type II toxin-antitoxin system HicB family antitoxin [Duodenibacillus sp.]|nr:type II toxin-antitoxin system HicB family antitoxin [Duodenibacillus sp.]
MKNVLTINGFQATVWFEQADGLLHGEFIALSPAVAFSSKTVDGLRAQAEAALAEHLERCAQSGAGPERSYSGKFNVRLPPYLHASLASLAKARGESLNDLVIRAVAELVLSESEEGGEAPPMM